MWSLFNIVLATCKVLPYKIPINKFKLHSANSPIETSSCIPTRLLKEHILALQVSKVLTKPSQRSPWTCNFAVARTTGWQPESAPKGFFHVFGTWKFCVSGLLFPFHNNILLACINHKCSVEHKFLHKLLCLKINGEHFTSFKLFSQSWWFIFMSNLEVPHYVKKYKESLY